MGLIDKEPKPLSSARRRARRNESLLTSASREIRVCRHPEREEVVHGNAESILQVRGVLADSRRSPADSLLGQREVGHH